jgi:hypothetical protein
MLKVLITILILNSSGKPVLEVKVLNKEFATTAECHQDADRMMEKFKRVLSEEAKDSGGGMTYRCGVHRAQD